MDRGKLWRSAAVAVEASRSSGAVALAAVVVYSLFAVAHWFLMVGTVQVVMTSVAAASAGIALALYWLVHGRGRGELVVNTILAIAGINTMLHMWLTGDPRQTSNVVLLVVAMGFFMLRPRVAAFSIGSLLAVWAYVMPAEWAEFGHYGFSMAAALLLAWLLGRIRRNLLYSATKAAHALMARQEREGDAAAST